MDRGIIQEATWSGPGTACARASISMRARQGHEQGRIWRITYAGNAGSANNDGRERDRTQPRMLNETPAQLVAHLSHANGWWRDTAQQLLVLKQDKSVAPALQQIARTSKNRYARVHALWTLEGPARLDPALVRQLMKDDDPRMRIQAIRASETLQRRQPLLRRRLPRRHHRQGHGRRPAGDADERTTSRSPTSPT